MLWTIDPNGVKYYVDKKDLDFKKKAYRAITHSEGVNMLNKMIFGQHLIDALSNLGLDAKKCNYRIYPIMEEGKKYSTKDEFVRLNVFPCSISEYVYLYEDIIMRFSIFEPYYPLWIKVRVKGDVVELYTSLRFRRPSEVLRNHTGFEPFIVLDN